MSVDRKVINKYFPPDFDPAKLPRAKKMKNKQSTVNMMMPMSVTCRSCGTYIYRGTKLNSKKYRPSLRRLLCLSPSFSSGYGGICPSWSLRAHFFPWQETVAGEDYLGIRIFRFYMKCPNCNSEFTIKTDPKNADYIVEQGVLRQMEPWKEEEDIRDALLEQRAGEEQGDAMKELENKTLDSKMEMEILDGLEEIKALNARQAALNMDDLLASRAKEDDKLDDDDELKLLETFEGGNKRLLHAEDDVNEDALLTRRKRRAPTKATDAEAEKQSAARQKSK